MKRTLLSLLTFYVFLCLFNVDIVRAETSYVSFRPVGNAFCLADGGRTAAVYVDSADWKGVLTAAGNLCADVERVAGTAARLQTTDMPATGAVVVGTVGKSRLIDELVRSGKLDVSSIKGKWESYLIETVGGNLVIAGSDKRGTIYGVYDLSEKIGVSPWYYFADVPAQQHASLYVKRGRYVQESPAVKYRGIFLNDEWPSLGGWTSKAFGGFNSKFYAHVFELLLRLKANFIWPAMWSSSFYEDDPTSGQLADDMGIVMGTSHHEPMMRPHEDYKRRRREVGPWNYAVNKERLDSFFAEGIERSKNFDKVVTIGMRGDGDVPMGGNSDEENMRVLQDVVKGEREVITQVTGKDPSEVPQLWAVFTEVQCYYDKGFEVPDDVLLLFCDNNWGYIRRVGPWKEQHRKGGMGLYYHIDMNGGPWNDRWINTTTIPKLREQFNLAYQTGIDDLWVVNVGDLKPKELPIDFIMRYAWDPDAIAPGDEKQYLLEWAEMQFGCEHASAIADIVAKYPKYNLWRKPETQSTGIMSVVNYHEADRVTALWRSVAAEADSVGKLLPAACQDAYYQLVLYPAKASAGVAEIYTAAAKNQLYARQGRVSANDYAQRVKDLYAADKAMETYYNKQLAGGKWDKMMSDIHFGYVSWSMPAKDSIPATTLVTPLAEPTMGVAVEGSEGCWPDDGLELPVFNNFDDNVYYIDVFNRGTGRFDFTVKADKSWVKADCRKGSVEKEQRVNISIDWAALKDGESEATVYVKKGRQSVPVKVRAVKAAKPAVAQGVYFGNPAGSEFSVPAAEYSAIHRGKYAKWIFLPDLGRGEGCMGLWPVTAPSAESIASAPCLEYQVYFSHAGKQTVCIGILPTQDVMPERGLRLAYGVDDVVPVTLDARQGFVDVFQEYTPANLKASPTLKPIPPRNNSLALLKGNRFCRNEVFDNLRWLVTEFDIAEPGLHTFKLYMVDPEIVLEQLVFNPDNAHPSYFGAVPVRHE